MDDIRRNDSNLQFSRQLALIQVAAVTLIVLVIGVTAVWISRAHDELSETGTKRMISGGISALEDKLQTIAVDYSVWALAYNAIRGHDIAWIYENVGTGAASEAVVFDLIMIIEPGEVERHRCCDCHPHAISGSMSKVGRGHGQCNRPPARNLQNCRFRRIPGEADRHEGLAVDGQ